MLYNIEFNNIICRGEIWCANKCRLKCILNTCLINCGCGWNSDIVNLNTNS